MNKEIVVFDLATTSFEDNQREITEFSALRIRNGLIQKSFHYSKRRNPGDTSKHGNTAGLEADREFSLLDQRQEIMNLFANVIIVGHDLTGYLSILEKELQVSIQQSKWDTIELARIFFPTQHYYQLAYLAEKLSLAFENVAQCPPTEQKAWLTWKLLEACWQKGLELDLSFYDQAKNSLQGWPGKGFLEELFKEINRRFPNRPIRTDLVLAPFSDGLFQTLAKREETIPKSIDWIVKVFSSGGILEQNLPGYESRTGQIEMAKLIAEGLNSSHHVVVEAGTGTGKSFAYLIPCLWSAKKSGQKVVVATHTIPLQEQLQKKDIPVLETVLPFSFKAAVMKGKGNYCCLKKWQGCLANSQEIGNREQKLAFLSVLVWLRETITGDIQELSKVPGLAELWTNINADVETCVPGRCSKAGVCFWLRARKKAEEADVLIVNHSLLFSDLKTDYNVLPEYHQLVIDEAHQIYQTALQHLGAEISMEQVARVIEALYRQGGSNFYLTMKQRFVSLTQIVPAVSWDLFAKRLEGIPELCLAVLEQTDELFEFLSLILGKERTFRLTVSHTTQDWWLSLTIQIENLTGRIKALLSALEGLTSLLSADEGDEIEELRYTLAGHQRELQEFMRIMTLVTNITDPKQVTWLERSSRLYLKSSPIEVSDILEEKFFSRLDSVVLTSATLSISNTFDHFLKEVGLPLTTNTARVDSPFDYERQMRFFVVKKGFQGQNSEEQIATELSEFITEVAERMAGRTLVLFTAHKLLRQTYHLLHSELARLGIETLAQGIHGERSFLLEAFKRNPKSILLGANSFWEGIDIPGEALSCVIMVKLPFWPPSLPLIEARSEFLASQSRDPFRELLLPEAVIRFKQGFGRLIRSKTDRGLVILLDGRVIDKYYGKYFLSSLPVRTHIRGDNFLVLRKIEEWNDRGLNEELL